MLQLEYLLYHSMKLPRPSFFTLNRPSPRSTRDQVSLTPSMVMLELEAAMLSFWPFWEMVMEPSSLLVTVQTSVAP